MDNSARFGTKQDITFPFTPPTDGIVILGIDQGSVSSIRRTGMITQDDKNYLPIDLYFSGQWSATYLMFPVFANHSYSIRDLDMSLIDKSYTWFMPIHG